MVSKGNFKPLKKTSNTNANSFEFIKFCNERAIAMKKKEKKEFNMQLHKPQAHMHVAAIVKHARNYVTYKRFFFGNNAICVLARKYSKKDLEKHKDSQIVMSMC